MKNIKKIVSAVCLGGAILLGPGCKKYLDINTNPSVTQDVLPEHLLSSAEIFLGSAIGVDLQINGSFWAQYWTQSPASSQYKIYDRYSPTSSAYDRSWQLIYSSALSDLDQLEKKGIEKNQRQYVGIAKVLKAYAFQIATDGWGDVPYSQALKGMPESGGITSPVYDPQSRIYDSLIQLIHAGRAILEQSEADGSQVNGDLIYGGTLSKWQQFANTLELKVGLRLSEKDPGRAQARVTDIITNAHGGAGFIDEQSDAQINYFSTAGNQNPLYSEMLGLNKTQNIVASKTVIDSMNANSDLRLEVFFNPTTSGFVGIAQGNYTVSSSTVVSIPNAAVGADANNTQSALAPVKFITSYESYFLQAEAAARGWGGGNAKSLFDAGVYASFGAYNQAFLDLQEILVDTPNYINGDSLRAPIVLNGTTGADAYLHGLVTDDSSVVIDPAYWGQFPVSGSVQDKVRHIITQKWFAMTGNQGFEAFAEWRRTGYPSWFTVSKQSALGTSPDIMPRRFFYPDVEVQRNLNFPGQKRIFDPMYWDIH